MLPCLDPEEFWGWVELDRWKEKRRLECGQVVWTLDIILGSESEF